MLVSFWSISHGQCGCTSNMLIYALNCVFSKKLKVLLSHTQFEGHDLEKYLYLEDFSDMSFRDMGFKPLVRLARNSMLSPEDFSNYTMPILKNMKLDLLSSMALNPDLKDEFKDYELNAINQVLSVASESYDIVFVDLPSGLHSELTQKILKKSDLVIVNLNQNKILLERFMKMDFSKINKNYIINISKFEQESKMTMRQIKNKYKFEHMIYTPYHPQIMDCLNQANIVEYFGRNLMNKNKSQIEFFNVIERMTNLILKRMNINL